MIKVREVHTIDGRPKRIVTDTTVYDIECAYRNNIIFDNAVIVNNKGSLSIRGRRGTKLVFKEVQNNVKGNAGNLGQISKSKSKSRCGNKAGGTGSKESNIRGRQQVSNNRRGKRGTEVADESRLERPLCSSSKTLRPVPVRLKSIGCIAYKEDEPRKFKEDFSIAKSLQKNGACVDEHSLSELSKMKLLRSNSGFVAIEDNGNITSVLRDVRKTKPHNFMRDLMLNAIANGGYKLDCFAIVKGGSNGGLAEMYTQYGFIPVVKDHFNRDFASDNWNYERDGEPDVVFMYHCGDNIETVAKKRLDNAYKHYLDYDVPYITDVPQYIKPSDDYDWEEDKDDLSTYSQALRYRDWKYEQYCKIM